MKKLLCLAGIAALAVCSLGVSVADAEQNFGFSVDRNGVPEVRIGERHNDQYYDRDRGPHHQHQNYGHMKREWYERAADRCGREHRVGGERYQRCIDYKMERYREEYRENRRY